MTRHLPKGWIGKRVAVLFETNGGFEGSLFNNNDGGVILDVVQDQRTRKLFIPWSSIRYVELLEEADERPPMQAVKKPRGA